jgi:hypothetical protein
MNEFWRIATLLEEDHGEPVLPEDKELWSLTIGVLLLLHSCAIEGKI